MRTAALLAIAGLAGLALAGCDWGTPNSASDDSTITEHITAVRFDKPAGEMTIVAGTGPVAVHRELHYHDNRPGQTTHVDGDTLVISACGDRCSVDYQVHVPPGTRVSGLVSAGTVRVTGAATVDVRSTSGDVTVTDVAGAVRADTTSGTVTVTGAGGAVAASTTNGDVVIGTTSVTDVDAHTSNGSVRLTVPQGAYRVHASTVHGQVHSAIPDDPNAGHTLSAVTTNGDVQLGTV